MFWSSLFITLFFEESDFQYLYNKQTYSWFFIWWNHDIRILCWFKEYSFPTTFLCIYATKLKWNLLALEMDRFTTKKFILLKNSSEKHFTCQMLQFINLLFNGSEVSHCFTIFICPQSPDVRCGHSKVYKIFLFFKTKSTFIHEQKDKSMAIKKFQGRKQTRNKGRPREILGY